MGSEEDEQQLQEAVQAFVQVSSTGLEHSKEAYEAWREVVAGVSWVVGTDKPATDWFADLGPRLSAAIAVMCMDYYAAGAKAGQDLARPKRGLFGRS